MRTLAFAGFVMALLPGCPGPATGLDHARQTAQEFNADMRYGRTEDVLDRVATEARPDFSDHHHAWGSEVRIADVEVLGLRPKGERNAEVSVRVAWYRPEEQELRTTIVEQSWSDKGGWQLVAERRTGGDAGLLGDAVVYQVPHDDGPPPQFKTVRLGDAPTE